MNRDQIVTIQYSVDPPARKAAGQAKQSSDGGMRMGKTRTHASPDEGESRKSAAPIGALPSRARSNHYDEL